MTIRSITEFELAPNQSLKLLRRLYGQAEKGDYWNYIFSKHIHNDIHKTQAVSDVSLFSHVNEQLARLAGTYVNASILATRQAFMDTTDATFKRVDFKYHDLHNFFFAGLKAPTTNKGRFLHKQKYISKLSSLLRDCF